MRRDVFQAIADPTRRSIQNMLARKAMTLNTLAENFDRMPIDKTGTIRPGDLLLL